MTLPHQMYPAQPLSPAAELAVAIGAGAMSLTLTDASKLPPAPNMLTLGEGEDAETVLYNDISGNVVTLALRGFDNTTAKAWPVGTKVARLLVADDINSLQKNLEAVAGVAKRTARFVVGTSTAGWTSADCDYLCDGTDDQVEINAALNALPAHGGEVVILDGTYNIAAPILIPKDNVSLQGNGAATVLKRMFDGDPDWENPSGTVELRSRQRCKVSKLTFDGNGDVYDGGWNVSVLLENSSFNEIAENTCNNNYDSGMYLWNSSNNTVTGNTCNNNNRGIYLVDSYNNTVAGNICNYNDTGMYLPSSSNNTVMGNICNNNHSSGIELWDSSNNTMAGNTCNNNYFGIALGSSDNNTVTGNTCNHNGYAGIDLWDSSNNTMAGNMCNNNNIGGIGLNGSNNNNNTVTGNTCIRGEGQPSDYAPYQFTIVLLGEYNLVAMNNCMGKAPVVEGGTGNSVYGNKYDEGDDLPPVAFTFVTTLDTTWTGASAPFSKVQAVAGILATDNPVVDVQLSGTYETDQIRLEEWGKIYRITTQNGQITAYATEKPTVDLPIQLKVVR